MKKMKWIIPVVVVLLVVVLWLTGLIPKQIARIAGTSYVKEHFPEMELEYKGVEWADVYGDYLISFEDKDGNKYSCVIGPTLFPTSLGQGLFAIEDYYAENYVEPEAGGTAAEDVFDIAVSYANHNDSPFLGGLNADKMSISSVRHLPIYKFDTLSELEQFKQSADGFTYDKGYDEVPSFNDTVAKYDESFFAENSLMLVYVAANNSTHRYGVNSVFCDGTAFCIHVEQTNNPESVDTAMSGWFITVAVLDSMIENCTEFDADLNNIE
ncbi:MAG: hypothetical protein IJN82_00930 [Clostridia bacterium]|nr:hypothetical protein [Clostridia bacterium]